MTIHRLYRDLSTPELKQEFADKMIYLATEKKYTLISQIARDMNTSFENLNDFADNHPVIREAYEKCKVILGMNAYEGIENRTLSGVFSKYAVTKYAKEVAQERDHQKDKETKREIEKIKAKQDVQNAALEGIMTIVKDKNGKTHGIVQVNENITFEE